MTQAFDRSSSGRRNRALFYDVDRIVYVEGGRADKGAMESFDGLFWRRVFGSVRPELRLRILPRGGKSNLVALAEAVNGSDDERTVIAMDRDYDGIFNRLIDRDNVVYTYGYSFENDIFCRYILEDLFLSVCPVCDTDLDIAVVIGELVDDFCRDVWWAQLADVCGVMVARKVIDRAHIPKYMTSNSYGVRPKISKSALSIDVYNSNSGQDRVKVRSVPYKKSYLPELAVGHLYANFCQKILFYLHGLHSNTSKLSKDAIISGAIANFAMQVSARPDSVLTQYYRNALENC